MYSTSVGDGGYLLSNGSIVKVRITALYDKRVQVEWQTNSGRARTRRVSVWPAGWEGWLEAYGRRNTHMILAHSLSPERQLAFDACVGRRGMLPAPLGVGKSAPPVLR